MDDSQGDRRRWLVLAVGMFAMTFHNRRRLRKHPEWGYLTPLEIRQRHRQGHTLAA
ncbi:hypothetical protein OG535_27185 [Kitasatospora sp. NBC_00085]|uniref:hypothetical protein n=1 Tax=unclassified Kitasatospora TaxID=2633591 RepID=UPI00324B2870